jgi:hypothetical protein
MNRKDFAARYVDALGKRFAVLDETEVTREETRLLRKDSDALFMDAIDGAPCSHGGGKDWSSSLGVWRCAICGRAICKECRILLVYAEQRWQHPASKCRLGEAVKS